MRSAVLGTAKTLTPAPLVVRYLHRPHRPGEIAPRAHPVPKLVEVVPRARLELGDADCVHARRPIIGPDLLPRPPQEALVDVKRLHLGLRSLRRLLPMRVGLQST
jgi:hypothetical protein